MKTLEVQDVIALKMVIIPLIGCSTGNISNVNSSLDRFINNNFFIINWARLVGKFEI
jgi:hypothetical protein